MSVSGSGKSKKRKPVKPSLKGGTPRWAEAGVGGLHGRAPTEVTTAPVVVKAVKRRAARPHRKSPLATSKPSKTRGLGVGGEKPEQRQYLEPDELKRFFDVMPKTSFWYAYFYIQYMYGCRISEVALLREEDVNFKKRQILIRRLKRQREKEGFCEVTYAADAKVLECVRTALRWKVQKKIPSPTAHRGGVNLARPDGAKANEAIDGNPFLFATDRRRALTALGTERLAKLRTLDGWQAVSRMSTHRMFRFVAETAGLPKNLQDSHVLRHSRAIILLVNGVSKEKVNDMLGHSSMKMTERYIPIAKSIRAKFGKGGVL